MRGLANQIASPILFGKPVVMGIGIGVDIMFRDEHKRLLEGMLTMTEPSKIEFTVPPLVWEDDDTSGYYKADIEPYVAYSVTDYERPRRVIMPDKEERIIQGEGWHAASVGDRIDQIGTYGSLPEAKEACAIHYHLQKTGAAYNKWDSERKTFIEAVPPTPLEWSTPTESRTTFGRYVVSPVLGTAPEQFRWVFLSNDNVVRKTGRWTPDAAAARRSAEDDWMASAHVKR